MTRRAIPRDLTGASASVSLASAEIVWDDSADILRLGDAARVGGHKIFTDKSAVAYGKTGDLQSIAVGFENNTRFFVGNPIGRCAILGFTRSSDNPTVDDMGTQGVTAFVEHDSNKFAYGFYGEMRRRAGAGAGHLMELGAINFGSVVDIDPFDVYANDMMDGLRLSAGRPDTPTNTNISSFITLVNAGAKAKKGIVFGSNSLDPISGGQMDAIALATNMAIQQFTSIGRGSRIRFDTTNPAQATAMVFANDIVALQGPADENYATFGPQVASFIGAVIMGNFTRAQLLALAPGDYQWATAVLSDGASNKPTATSDGTNWRYPDGVIVT